MADQKARCRSYAAVRGWAIVDAWQDIGSGLASDRPVLAALEAAVAAGVVDTVVATDAAHLNRVPAASARLLGEAARTGATVALVDGERISNPAWHVLAADRSGPGTGGVGRGAAPRSRRPWRRR